MKIKNSLAEMVLLLSFLMFSSIAFAQDEDEGIEPPPAAPINDYIPHVLVLTSVLGYYYFSKMQNVKTLNQNQ